MSGEAADWSQPEMVRAINRLTEALGQFESGVQETFSGLDTKYVPREVHNAALQLVNDRITAEVQRLNDRITTSEAAADRTRSWHREILAPLISGVMVGTIVLVLSLLAHHPVTG